MATSKEIDLGDDDDPEVVEGMIRFIYGLAFTKIKLRTPESTSDMKYWIDAFEVTDKNDVEGLAEAVVKEFMAGHTINSDFVLGSRDSAVLRPNKPPTDCSRIP